MPIMRRKEFSILSRSSEFADERGWTIIAVQSSMVAVAMIVTFFRIYIRRKRRHRLGADDWWIIAAWVVSMGHLAVGVIAVKHGSGRHVQTVTMHDFQIFLSMIWLLRPTYQFIVLAVKMSLLSLYLRMFPSRKLRITIWVLIVVILLQSVVLILLFIFQCMPIDAAWLIGKPKQCIDGRALVITGASLNVVADFTILILPMPILFKLHVDWKRRLGIILTFSLGSLACAASMVRLSTLCKLYATNDMTYNTVSIAISSALEVSLGVITASLPLIRPSIENRLKKTWSCRSQTQRLDDGAEIKPVSMSESSVTSSGSAPVEKKLTTEHVLKKEDVKFIEV